MRLIVRRSVLLPHPEGPISAVIRLRAISKSMPCSAWNLPYTVLERSISAIIETTTEKQRRAEDARTERTAQRSSGPAIRTSESNSHSWRANCREQYGDAHGGVSLRER